ncbi:hypothetical protein V490_01476 [Pseudogymnoascus sp. VKM F-3557]|nr:hypothetical protein V490_01476 [Pseudogymnoascus sp. VKM F-3557]
MAQRADSNSEDTEESTEPSLAIKIQLLILGCFPLSEGIAWATTFPYIYSMVKSLSGPDSSDDNIALYAGIMVSVFPFGEFVGAPLWAKVSDGIGRKPTILIGSMGAVFSAILFGFSTSLPMAIAARACAGLLNPNMGVVPTFVGELVPKRQQGMASLQSVVLRSRTNAVVFNIAIGFSFAPVLRGIGVIIGPVIGGYLAEPVNNYPSLFHKGTIWDKFPYLLPNLVVVIFLLSSCTLGLFCLEEVHPKFRDQVDIRWTLVSRMRNILTGKGWKADENIYARIRADEIDPELPASPTSPAATPEEPGPKSPSPYTRQIKLQILYIAIQGFLKIATLALVPIFLETPKDSGQPQNQTRDFDVVKGTLGIKGGFGLDTISTSNVLLSQAAASIVGQIYVPGIIKRYGMLRCYRAVVLILLCLYYLLPFTANWSTWTGMPTMLIILWVYALATGLATTCSQMLITHTLPSRDYLSEVNGRAAQVGCLARALGPAVSGQLFKLGLQIGYVGLPFWLLGAVTGLGGIVSLYLTDHA